jgi:hypothetical protein
VKTKKKLYDQSTNNIMLYKSIIVALVLLFSLCVAGSEFAFANPLIKIGDIEAGLSTTASVSITFENGPFEMGGFDFLIHYDPLAFSLISSSMGQLLLDCDWEYFTYRYEGSALIGLTAYADINNGDIHPSCYGPPDTNPHELAELNILITDSYSYVTCRSPISFYWADCGDNTISSVAGDTLYVSDHVYDFEGTEITDSTYGFPTFFGIQGGCLETIPEKPDKIQSIDFMSGTVYIYDDFMCGDANWDGSVNIFDVTMIISYLYMGGPAPVPMISADVNNDGVVNIFDVTRLISFLYMQGQPPECPE